MRISDWSSDVCSSDLVDPATPFGSLLTDRAPGGDAGHGGGEKCGLAMGSLPDAPDLPAQLDAGGLEHPAAPLLAQAFDEIGRASCWERVFQYVYISVAAVSLKKKKISKTVTKD